MKGFVRHVVMYLVQVIISFIYTKYRRRNGGICCTWNVMLKILKTSHTLRLFEF